MERTAEQTAIDAGRHARGARTLAHLAAALPLVGLVAIACAALAWNDRLPGGWRLRKAFEPARAREARETLRHALDRMALFAREEHSVATRPIVFIGSSTIERFPLAELFPGKPCVNRGIANARLALLAQLAAHLLPPADSGGPEGPAGLVVYAGTVDWRASGGDIAATVAGVEALLAALRARLADTPILLLGPLPERDIDRHGPTKDGELADLESALAARVSAGTSRIGDPFFRVTLLPLARPPLATPAGALAEELSADRLHLNKDGYSHVAAWIQAGGGEIGRSLMP